MAVFLLKKRASRFLCQFYIEGTRQILDSADQLLCVIFLLGREKYVPFDERETLPFCQWAGRG